MNLDLPENLDSTRQLLEGSLHLRTDETAPPVPAGLLDELNARYAPREVVFDAEPPKRSWFAALRDLMAHPAIGAPAVAAIVLSVAIPVALNDPAEPTERFRGLATENESTTEVLLIGGPTDIDTRIAGCGDLERESLTVLGDLMAAAAIEGPKVIVDFDNSTIRSIDAGGREVFTADMPSDIGELSLALARAVSRL